MTVALRLLNKQPRQKVGLKSSLVKCKTKDKYQALLYEIHLHLESDEDDAMETGEDKDETKSPSKSVDTAALSPEPSKFDEPRSPVLSDKKGKHYDSYHLHHCQDLTK